MFDTMFETLVASNWRVIKRSICWHSKRACRKLWKISTVGHNPVRIPGIAPSGI